MTFALIATILWYFPGFGTGELPTTDKERLKASFSADQVACKQWCSPSATWEESVANVSNASQSVVTEIQSLKPDERKDIVLVGHSLGGRVVAYSLAKLGELGISIQTAVLLAPAISSGDQYASKLCRGCSSIILVVGENDLVLKWIYPFVANGTSAIEAIDGLDDETKYLRYVVPNQYIWRQDQLGPSHNASVYIRYLVMRRSGDDFYGSEDLAHANNLGLEHSVEAATKSLNIAFSMLGANVLLAVDTTARLRKTLNSKFSLNNEDSSGGEK